MMFWTRSGDLMVMVVLGRHGHAVRPGDRRGRRFCCWRRRCRASPNIRPHPRPDAAPGRALPARRHRRPAREARAVAEPLLQIEGLTKRFGGVVASDDITLDVPRGELHAIIGPNGAGKTTLIGQLAGEIAPRHRQHPIRRRRHHARCRSIAAASSGSRARSRSPRCFRDFTALDNVALAVQAHAGHSFRFWSDARRDDGVARAGAGRARPRRARRTRRHARRQAQPRRAPPARDRHGARHASRACCCSTSRWPAWARTNPPAWWRCCASSRASITILLIEHDMEAVFALADRITVLVYGRVIASGDPAAIRANAEVREAYLGEQEAACMAEPPLLEVDQHRDQLRPEPGAVRHFARHRAGRNGDADGPQRHGQDHDRALDHGADAGDGGLDPLRRRGHPRPAVLSRRQARHRPGAGRPAGLSQSHHARKPGRDRGQPHAARAIRGRSTRSARCFRGSPSRAGSMANLLSGGEQQMLAIGRALMTNPRLLILDEATEGLAPLIRDEIWRCLQSLRAAGQSILVIDKNVAGADPHRRPPHHDRARPRGVDRQLAGTGRRDRCPAPLSRHLSMIRKSLRRT